MRREPKPDEKGFSQLWEEVLASRAKRPGSTPYGGRNVQSAVVRWYATSPARTRTRSLTTLVEPLGDYGRISKDD